MIRRSDIQARLDRPLSLLDWKLEQLQETALNEGTKADGTWHSRPWRLVFKATDKIGSKLTTYLYVRQWEWNSERGEE